MLKIGCPINFSDASRQPTVGCQITLLLRVSDNVPNGEPGVAIHDGSYFMGWIRSGGEKDSRERLARRIRLGGQPLRGRIESITKRFEWESGGGWCVEGTVLVFP